MISGQNDVPSTSTTGLRFDVFLSYNRRDAGEAEALANALRDRAVSVFFDKWCLRPGEPWTKAIEDALGACPAVMVVLGPNGMSDWQRAESELALDRQRGGDRIVVIPVLIRGADPPLGFLRLNTWVDFRSGLEPASLERLAHLIRGIPVAEPPAICPYRGLRPFRQEDAAFFFGREEFVVRAARAIAACPLVAVVGASGSGKSSAVRAGLLPALRQQADGEPWTFLLVVPGSRPMHALAAGIHELLEPGVSETERLVAIGDLAEQLLSQRISLRDAAERLTRDRRQRLLLFIDQFEELYTRCTDERVRTRFIDEVLAATGDGTLRAIFTVRADFFDDVLGYRPLADRLQSGVVSLGPMNREELRRCIEEPARGVGLGFEPGLVERILEDVERGAGTLPLLEFVLTELWQQRRGDTLVHSAYTRMGEVQGAIARRADEEFERLDDAERQTLRRIMLKLVQTSPDAEDTRRRATRGEIGEAAWPVVLKLADARLLVTTRDDVTDEEVVEVAHEALIRHWTRLRAWLDADREFMLWRRRLAAALEQHALRPHDPGALLRGAVLAEALRRRDAREDELSDAERAFIATSAGAARRARVHRVVMAGGLVVAFLAAAGFAVRMVRAHQVARAMREWRLLSTAAAQPDPLIAALMVRELSARREPQDGARFARQIADRAIPIAVLDRGRGKLRAAAIAPDGDRVLTGYDDGAVLLWPADARGAPRELGSAGGDVRSVAINRDGSLALSVSDSAVRVWRVDGEEVALPPRAAEPADGVAAANFDPNGTRLVTASIEGAIHLLPLDGSGAAAVFASNGTPSGVFVSPDGRAVAAVVDSTVELFDAAAPAAPRVLGGHSDQIVSAGFDRAGAHVVTASRDGTVRLWQVASGAGRVILRSDDGSAAWSAVFDTDGRSVVASFQDRLVRAWHEDAPAAGESYPGHRDVVWLVRFSPDGRRILSAGADSTARIWRTARPTAPPTVLAGHAGPLFAVAFSADGSRIITAAHDGTVRVWPGKGRVDPRVVEATAPVFAGALSADGSRIALGGDDGVAWVWRADTSAGTPLRGHRQGIRAIAFDPAGERILTVSWDSTARVWDAAGRPLAMLSAGPVATGVFSPDGERMITGSDDGRVTEWSGPEFGNARELAEHHDLVRAVAVSPDGRSIASVAADGTVRLLREGTGPEPLHGHSESVRGVAFAPDGSLLVTASEDGTAIIWNAVTGDSVRVLRGHLGWVRSARFDARSTRVLTASDDGTARIWEATGTSSGLLLSGHEAGLQEARFSDAGDRIAAAGIDGIARVYRLDRPGDPIVLAGHDAPLRDALFTPDGDHLLTISEDGSASMWSIGWAVLQRHLGTASAMCLRLEQRAALLGEKEGAAEAAHRDCERKHGRE